jgi:hypothetical protein
VYRLLASMLPLVALLCSAADKPAPVKKQPPAATPAELLKVLKDFKAELLYSIRRDGSSSPTSTAPSTA